MSIAQETTVGYYQHRYGGLYLIANGNITAHSTDSGEPLILYHHVYPFEQKCWVRPLSEWTTDRFTKITAKQALDILGQHRAELKSEIAARKANKK
jgi:hypothetical protein